PDVVVRPRIGQGLHIAPLERIERITDELNLLVVADLRSGFRHRALLRARSGSTRPRAGMTTPQSRLWAACVACQGTAPVRIARPPGSSSASRAPGRQPVPERAGP